MSFLKKSLKVLPLVFIANIVLSATAATSYTIDLNTQAEAINILRKAESLQAEGRSQEALLEYEKVLKQYSNVVNQREVLLKVAQCHSHLGDDEQAIRIFLKVISDDPDSLLASQAVSLMINLYSQRYRFDEVIMMSRNLAQQFPGTEAAAMAIYRVAGYFYSQGRFEEAINEYKNFMDQFPGSVMRGTAFSRLVSLYIRQGMFDEAESLLATKLDEGAKDTYMLRQLALVYQKQGKYGKALELYEKLLATDPNDISIHEQLGELYVEMGYQEKALAEWSKITESASNQYSRHQMLAFILKSHGFHDQAAAEYRKAIELQPLASYLYTQLADTYVVKKQFDLAIDTYLDALITLPVDFPNRDEITTSMLELCSVEGFCDTIVSRLQAQITRSPDSVPALLTLADVHFHQGKFRESLERLKAIVFRYPDGSRLLFDHAQTLERERHFSYAIEFYQAILDLFPGSDISSTALMNIGQLRSQLHQPEAAIESFRMLISHASDGQGRDSRPDWLYAYILAGDVYLEQMQDVESALSMYRKARDRVQARPDLKDGLQITMPELDLKIAECYRLMGSYEIVENILGSIQIAQRFGSIGARIAKLRGDTYFSSGDFDNALKQYTEATKQLMNEDWVNDCLDRMAMIKEYSDAGQNELLKVHAQLEILQKTGRYNEALELCVSVIGEYESASRIQLEMGNLLTFKARFMEAISAYEKLVQTDSPLAPEAQFKIAEIHDQQLNDPKQALAEYSELIQKYPESVVVADARKRIRQLASQKIPDLNIP